MNFHNDQSAIVRYSLHSVALRTIQLLRQQKDWEGFENVVFLTINTECMLWQYGLWSFQTGYTKLERFLHKNEQTQRKLLNFENWTNGEHQ